MKRTLAFVLAVIVCVSLVVGGNLLGVSHRLTTANKSPSANIFHSQAAARGSPAQQPVSADPAGVEQLNVFVGYADNLRPSGFFPNPWQGSPGVVFNGGGGAFDSGAIRIDNTGSSNITIDSVSVDLSRPGPFFNLWGSNLVAPTGSSLILTQTGCCNFDSSDFPFEPCGAAAAVGQAPFPRVFVTIGGVSHQFNDTAHVLDTLGYDLACQGNESEQWRPIGTFRGNQELTLTPFSTTATIGSSVTLTATLINNSTGTPISGSTILFTMTGPNALAATLFPCVTGTTGTCTLTYTGVNAGTDLILGIVLVGGTSINSPPVFVTWTGGAMDFSIAASPDDTVLRGESGSYLVSLSLLSGTAQPVTLSVVSGLPSGASATFSRNTPTPSATVGLQIATSLSGGLGDFVVTIQGQAGSVVHTVTVNLHVYDFIITSSLCEQTVLRGSIAPFNLTFTLVAGSSTVGLPPISIQTSGLPPDATFSLSTVTLSSTPVVVAFQIKTGSVSLGDFPFSISGVDSRASEGGSRQVSNCSGGFAAHVYQPTIGFSCSNDAVAGGSIFCTISVGLISGSSQFGISPGTFSFTGLPPGSFVFCSPPSGVPPFTAGCTIGIPSGSSGLFSFGVSGVFGGGAFGAGGGTVAGTPSGGGQGGTLTLHIYDFTVQVNPEETVLRGGTALYNVTVALVPGSSTVNLPTIGLTISGLPTGTVATLSPTSGNAAGFSALLMIQTTSSTPLGDFPLIVNGTDARPLLGGFRLGTGMLHVYDFRISSSPSSSFATFPGSASFNETLTLLPGSSTVAIPLIQLKANGLPAGSSATFSPPSAIPSFAGTLTVLTIQPSIPGTFNLAIVGTDPRVPEGGSRSSLPQSPQTLIVLAQGSLTDTSYCPFDQDSSLPGQQFTLIYTPNPASPSSFKLTASNPGQFYDNVFFAGNSSGLVTLKIQVPYPFITQGAVPIQVYSRVGFSGPCFVPLSNITPSFAISAGGTLSTSGAPTIVLGDYNPQAFGSTVTVTVTGQIPSSGLVYVTIHLNYALKGTVGYAKNTTNDAVNATTSVVLIPNLESYSFAQTGSAGGVHLFSITTVRSENAFKKDPGVGGLVLDQNGTPVTGATVEIYDSTGNILAIVNTDKDGWYMWSYKYTGKPATFTIALPNFGIQQSVTLKSNGFIVANFSVKV